MRISHHESFRVQSAGSGYPPPRRNADASKRANAESGCRGDTLTRSRTPATVVIVHSASLTRLGLAELVGRSGDYVVRADTAAAAEARALLVQHQPELLVSGLTLNGGDGVELIRECRKLSPRTRAVVLTTRTDAAAMERAFRSGASAYVAEEDSSATMLHALGEALRGELFASAAVSHHLIKSLVTPNPIGRQALNRLSDREWLVFRRLGAGDGPAALARTLHVSVKTVETYQARLKEKLGCRTAAELNARAFRWTLAAMRQHLA